MLRIDGKQTESPQEMVRDHSSEGEGLLFLGVLVASWMIAIGVGWVLWQLVPL
jgi:hypothetical protein